MSYVLTMLIVDDSRLSRLMIGACITQVHPDQYVRPAAPFLRPHLPILVVRVDDFA
jgi:hypothetical protein